MVEWLSAHSEPVRGLCLQNIEMLDAVIKLQGERLLKLIVGRAPVACFLARLKGYAPQVACFF